MYSDPNLDAPPPRSQFRRPWSPEVFDPNPSSSAYDHDDHYPAALYNMPEHHHHHHSHGTSPHRQQQQHPRRDASDASVDALDLADYSRTLRARQAEDAYPPFPSQIRLHDHEQEQEQDNPGAALVASSFPALPRPSASASASAATSRDTLRTAPHGHGHAHGHAPPSLVSRGPTLSSSATHDTHITLSSNASRGHRHPAQRRPFSLPVSPTPASVSFSSSHASSSRAHLHLHPDTHAHAHPYSTSALPREEIDISHFPKWSRKWYNNNIDDGAGRNATSRYPDHLDEDDDMYASIPGSQLPKQKKRSLFDPGYVHDPYDSSPPAVSATGHGYANGSRDVLPWSSDPPGYGPPLDPLRKAERMRMLEREFGDDDKSGGTHAGKGKGRDRAQDRGVLLDAEGRPLVGTADARGRLVTKGPKRRAVARVLQIVLAGGASVPVLYAAVAIKQPSTGAGAGKAEQPPPAGKPPVLVLYVVSVGTLVLLVYVFVVRAWCCGGRGKKVQAEARGVGGAGMMVLPMVGGGGGGGGKKKKKGKGKGKKGEGDVQVNLIVDPGMFRAPSEASSSSSSSEDEGDEYDHDREGAIPGAFNTHSKDTEKHSDRKRRKRRHRRRRRRRGVLEGLEMEARWRGARRWTKQLALLDAAGCVLWFAAFVFIMTGRRCPSGGFAGWCNAYNVSTASACLLCVAFGVSLFFDVQDLYASKESPRTRGG